jgi:N,N-dimethylformamidase
VSCPWGFNADLHLVDWLETHARDYDLVTDHCLHGDGVELLRPYRVVVTGSHPEYWTGAMLDALEEYLAGGGRLMYLGGNGFYWVTAIDPERPHMIEVRRGHTGTRAWEGAPGENQHSTTGEVGGLWRHRGRESQKLVGVGITAMGSRSARPYRRMEGSFEPRVSFVFEGVGETRRSEPSASCSAPPRGTRSIVPTRRSGRRRTRSCSRPRGRSTTSTRVSSTTHSR